MQNLREQLLKAGLISESDKKKAEVEKPREPPRAAPERARPSSPRPPQRDARPSPGGGGSARGGGRPVRDAPIPKLPPLADPNNKEFQRLEAKKQLELNKQIRDLVLAAQVPVELGTHTFYFVTRKNRLRRMEMTPEQAKLLETGKLAVVERPEPSMIEHSLVPAETAEKLFGLQERAVRFFNRTGAPVGFLSDEEISRRQKVETERAADPVDPAATSPDDAQDPLAGQTPPSSESLAEGAERTAPVTSTEEPNT